MSNPYDRFYPFHVPNMMMVSKDSEDRALRRVSAKWIDIARLRASTCRFTSLRAIWAGCSTSSRSLGISYLEILMGLEHTRSIEAALQACFLPSRDLSGNARERARSYP